GLIGLTINESAARNLVGSSQGPQHLRHLLLDRNPVLSETSLQQIRQHLLLETLSADDALADEANPLDTLGSLSGLTELTRLSLDGNLLGRNAFGGAVDVLSGLGNLPSLRYLSLVDNEIGSIDELAALPRLEMLLLRDNAIANIDALAGQKIIDAGDLGYSEQGIGWLTQSQTLGYGGDIRVLPSLFANESPDHSPSNSATYTFGDLAAEPYDVYVTWPTVAPGFETRMVRVSQQIDSTSEALSILNGSGGQATIIEDLREFSSEINYGGYAGTFANTHPYPNGVADESLNDFVLQATAWVTIPVGTWSIGFASDDGGLLELAGVNFTAESGEGGGVAGASQLRYEGVRSHLWTTGQFTVSGQPLTTQLTVMMFERTFGDSLELAIRPGINTGIVDSSTWSLLADGVEGWQVYTGSPDRELQSRWARYTVNGDPANTLEPVDVNQRFLPVDPQWFGGQAWQYLGRVTPLGGELRIELSGTDGNVIADAVRIERAVLPNLQTVDLRGNPLNDVALDEIVPVLKGDRPGEDNPSTDTIVEYESLGNDPTTLVGEGVLIDLNHAVSFIAPMPDLSIAKDTIGSIDLPISDASGFSDLGVYDSDGDEVRLSIRAGSIDVSAAIIDDRIVATPIPGFEGFVVATLIAEDVEPVYRDTILSQAPTLYYRFNELGGNPIADEMDPFRSGWIANGVRQGVTGPLSGVFNSALEFDQGSVDLGYRQFSSISTTVSFWMRWGGGGEEQTALRAGLYEFMFDATGRFGVSTGSGDLLYIKDTPNLTNQWVHVAATLVDNDVSLSRLYINGERVELEKGSVNPRRISVDGYWVAGAGATNPAASVYDPFVGQLDEIAAFDRALSPQEIKSQYEARIHRLKGRSASVDFRINVGTGSISGRYFNDLNQDGYADENVPSYLGVEGQPIYLDVNVNGVFDAGTDLLSLTDASGNYRFDGLTFGRYLVSEFESETGISTGPQANQVFVTSIRDGDNGINGLDDASSSAVSADGRFVYVTSGGQGAIAVFEQDALTFQLTQIQTIHDGESPAIQLAGASDLVLSPNGAHLYAISNLDETITVFERDSATGWLNHTQTIFSYQDGLPSLWNAAAIVVAPSGSHLYVVTDQSLIALDRDSVTGALTFRQSVDYYDTFLAGLDYATDVAITPDGAHVIVAGQGGNALSVFSRDSATGILTHLQTLIDEQGGIDSLGGAKAIAVDPSGNFVYAVAEYDEAITVFSRDSGTGLLSHLQTLRNLENGINGLTYPTDIAIDSTGENVFVTSGDYIPLLWFGRDTTTGMLTYLQTSNVYTPGIEQWAESSHLSIAPSGDAVYVTRIGDDSISTFYPFNGVFGQELWFIESLWNGRDGVDGLDGTHSLVVSDDGQFVTVAGGDDKAMSVFRVDPITRNFIPVQTLIDGRDGVYGLWDVNSLSHDGSMIFVNRSSGLTTYAQDPLTGELSRIQEIIDGQNGIDSLRGASDTVVVDDFVYVASRSDDAVTIFSRDPNTKQLNLVAAVVDQVGGITGINGATALAIDGSGEWLVVASEIDNSVAVFRRDVTTGMLAQMSTIYDEQNGITNLQRPSDIAIVGDYVLVTASWDNAITVLHLDRLTGTLALVQTYRDGDAGVDGLYGASSLDVSNHTVVVSGRYEDELAVFDFDEDTGSLLFRSSLPVGPNGVILPSGGANSVVIRDGHFFVTDGSDDAVFDILPFGPGHDVTVGVGTEIVENIDFGHVRIVDLGPDRGFGQERIMEGDTIQIHGAIVDPNTSNAANRNLVWTLTDDQGNPVDAGDWSTNGTSLTFQSADDGIFEAKLEVTYNNLPGSLFVDSVTINVQNVIPRLAANASQFDEGDKVYPITDVVTIADVDVDLDGLVYEWSVSGPGLELTSFSSILAAAADPNWEDPGFVLPDDGQYQLQIRVADDDEPYQLVDGVRLPVRWINRGGWEFFTLTTTNVPPAIDIDSLFVTPSSVDEGTSLLLYATIVEPGSIDPVKLAIDWGDGSDLEMIGPVDRDSVDWPTLTISHVYEQDAASYTVRTFATDDLELADLTSVIPQSFTIAVNNVAPRIDSVDLFPVNENQVTTLT
ncbi:MAG: beta-propeller fold lactonase family protein, partial [Planctomycetales bacterium]|nr:beta-propeller fold lactonase family protein [Planctomycetales bacterium]